MKFKSTFILGIVLVGGVAAVYLLDYKAGEEKKVLEALSSKLIQLESDKIRGVKLSSEYGTVSLIKNAEGEFRINAPVSAKTDKNAIKSLIRAAGNIKKNREIASGENLNLASFGLNKPLVEVHFLLNDSSVTGFSLGEESPTGDYIFASVLGEDKVFTIPKSVHFQMNKKLFDLRDKKILSFKNSDISKIFVKTKDFEYEINRLFREFLMMKPAALSLESGKINSLLSRLSNGRVKKFIDTERPAPDIMGLAQAETTIRMETFDSSRQLQLYVGNAVNKDGKAYRYAMDASRSTIMLIDSSLAELLEKRPFDLIKKEVLIFDKDKVDEFNIRYGKVDLNLTKDNGVWNVIHPEKFTADTDKTDELLEIFLSLKASAVEEYDPKSFKEYVNKFPSLTITLYQDSVEANFIRVGKKVGNESFLKSGGSHPVYRILNSAIEKLKVSTDYFRKEE